MYPKELTLLWVPAVCRWDTPRRQRTSWPSETEPRPPPAVRTATVRWRAAMRARPSRGRGRTAAAAWPQSCKRCLTRPWHFIFTLGCHYWSQRQFKETTCWNSIECWFAKILSTLDRLGVAAVASFWALNNYIIWRKPWYSSDFQGWIVSWIAEASSNMGCRSAWRHEERASAAAAPRGREWRACWAREWRRLHRDGFNISICRVTRPHIGQENVTQVWSTIVTGKSLWKFSKYTPLQILLCWQQENNQLEKHEVAKAGWFVLIFLCLVLLVFVWALPGLTGLYRALLGSAGTYLALPGLAWP